MANNENEAISALDEFIVNNPDLAELEALIGRLNIFDALGIADVEIRHSNFLGWMLDPEESHGQGALFLKAILLDALRMTPMELRPYNPSELDGMNFRGVEVRREYKHIDLMVICREPSLVLVVENKWKSSESDGQLSRYKEIIRQEYPQAKILFLFLSLDRSEPTDPDWVAYGYEDVYKALDRTRRVAAGTLGDDLSVVLSHYLRLLEGKCMNDPKIDEICNRIYRNHRRALDLIYERGVTASGLLGQIHAYLSEKSSPWHVVATAKDHVRFIPKTWLEILPAIGDEAPTDSKAWITFWIWTDGIKVTYGGGARPTTDPNLRKKIVERLCLDRSEFGFTGKCKTNQWTSIQREITIHDGEKDDQDNWDEVQRKLDVELKKFQERIKGVPAAIRSI